MSKKMTIDGICKTNNIERDLRRRLKKSIRKRTELNNRILKALNTIKLLRNEQSVTINDLDLLEKELRGDNQ